MGLQEPAHGAHAESALPAPCRPRLGEVQAARLEAPRSREEGGRGRHPRSNLTQQPLIRGQNGGWGLPGKLPPWGRCDPEPGGPRAAPSQLGGRAGCQGVWATGRPEKRWPHQGAPPPVPIREGPWQPGARGTSAPPLKAWGGSTRATWGPPVTESHACVGFMFVNPGLPCF